MFETFYIRNQYIWSFRQAHKNLQQLTAIKDGQCIEETKETYVKSSELFRMLKSGLLVGRVQKSHYQDIHKKKTTSCGQRKERETSETNKTDIVRKKRERKKHLKSP